MSDCCNPQTPSKTTQTCPECGSVCKSVGMPTLYHQVRFPENQGLVADTYHFCAAKQCSIAYFSIDGQRIAKQHLRTCTEIQNDKLCYCFDIDAGQYLSAMRANQFAPIKDFVIQRTKVGECACEIRNPSGQCCLAHFKALEKAL